MAVRSFTPAFRDLLTGTRRADLFIARSLKSIAPGAGGIDGITGRFGKNDVIDLPGDYGRRDGSPFRLNATAFTHNFGRDGEFNVLIDRLSDLGPDQAIAVRFQIPGAGSGVNLFVNDRNRGWDRFHDGLIALPFSKLSQFNSVSII
jgi:hypothetical protein